ncbi:MAG: glycosyltransferase family 2 protein [bacterium]|nr:glycosyltransferase family 2 protein [bacterium]
MFEHDGPRAALPRVPLPPLVVVIVNWNGMAVLRDCLASLRDSRYHGLRVILVDNGSTDNSVPWTRQHHPGVEIIEAGENLRWAGGNNVALRRLLAEDGDPLILLLNNDTIVPEGSLHTLARALAADPLAWLATPRICYASDPARVWYDGGVVGRHSGWVRHDGIRKLAGRLDPQPRYVDYGTGCALLMTSAALRRLGLFDESFHFYGEDADYSLRARAAGGRILHVPRSLVLHKVSATLGQESPQRAWLRSRSHVRLMRTHWPRREWPLLLPSQAGFFAGHMAWNLWHGRLATALAIWQGAIDELSGRSH